MKNPYRSMSDEHIAALLMWGIQSNEANPETLTVKLERENDPHADLESVRKIKEGIVATAAVVIGLDKEGYWVQLKDTNVASVACVIAADKDLLRMAQLAIVLNERGIVEVEAPDGYEEDQSEFEEEGEE